MDIYNEEMDSPAIESALEADARRGVDVRVTMTADSSWNGAFAQLAAAGVHIRTYAASAALYIHAKMILTAAEAFLGSENFSPTSMDDNRELGLITPDSAIRASLSRTFDADYAKATPYASGSTGTGTGSSTPAQCSVTASFSSRYDDWDVYVHSNQPEATATVTDSLRHDRQLPLRRERLRRHLSQSARERRRAEGHRPRRAGNLHRHPLGQRRTSIAIPVLKHGKRPPAVVALDDLAGVAGGAEVLHRTVRARPSSRLMPVERSGNPRVLLAIGGRSVAAAACTGDHEHMFA